jgi:hypothetical protein
VFDSFARSLIHRFRRSHTPSVLLYHFTHYFTLPNMVQTSLLFALAALTSLMEASPIRRASSGKRGIAFPKNFNGQQGSAFTHAFQGSQVSWMYDWEAVIDGTPLNLEYVPLLHSNEEWCTAGFKDNVNAAIKKYTVKNVLSFNEPDQVG